MQNNDRAKQFMPFDALKGFKEEINKRKRVIVAKRELSEDDLQELQNKVYLINTGMIVEITYYDNDQYVKIKGMVSKINFDLKYIVIVKTKINIDCIVNINL